MVQSRIYGRCLLSIIPVLLIGFVSCSSEPSQNTWEWEIYELIEQRYPQQSDYPNVTIVYFHSIDVSETAQNEDSADIQPQSSKITLFDTLRETLKVRWNLWNQPISDFNGEELWRLFTGDKDAQNLAQELNNDELEMLWVWIFQSVTEDFAKFERFYKQVVLVTQLGWRKSLYELMKSRYESGNITIANKVLTVSKFDESELDDEETPTPSKKQKKTVKGPDDNTIRKFTKTKAGLLAKWNITQVHQENLANEFYEQKVDEERQDLLKDWSEWDLELLKVWIHQTITEDFAKFERFFWKIVQIDVKFKTEILKLIETSYAQRNGPDYQVEIVKFNEDALKNDESVSTERIRKLNSAKKSLRGRWQLDKISESGLNNISRNYFINKLNEDEWAQQLVWNWPKDDIEILWVWLMVTFSNDFQKFENIYRKTVRFTMKGWEKRVYMLLKLKFKNGQIPGSNIINVDISTFKPSSFHQNSKVNVKQANLFVKLRKSFRMRRGMRESDFLTDYLVDQIATMEEEYQQVIKKMLKKELTILLTWIYQDVTDNYVKFHSFSSNVVIIEKDGWEDSTFELLREIHENDLQHMKIVYHPSINYVIEGIYDDFGKDKIILEERRQTFTGIRKHLRNSWSAKEQQLLKYELDEFREMISRDVKVTSVVKRWPEEEVELLWAFTIQFEQEDFKKFESLYWNIVKITRNGWQTNVFNLLKSMYDNEKHSHVKIQEPDTTIQSKQQKFEGDDLDKQLNSIQRMKGEGMIFLRILVRKKWNLIGNVTPSINELEQELDQDETVQNYLEKNFDDDLDLFWLWILQNVLTDFYQLQRHYKLVVEKYNPQWRKNAFKLISEIFKNENDFDIIHPQSFESEEESKLEEQDRDSENAMLEKLRNTIRLKWKVIKMKEFDFDYFETRLASNNVTQSKLTNFNEKDRKMIWLWIFLQDAVKFSKFKAFYLKIVKDKIVGETKDSEETTSKSRPKPFPMGRGMGMFEDPTDHSTTEKMDEALTSTTAPCPVCKSTNITNIISSSSQKNDTSNPKKKARHYAHSKTSQSSYQSKSGSKSSNSSTLYSSYEYK